MPIVMKIGGFDGQGRKQSERTRKKKTEKHTRGPEGNRIFEVNPGKATHTHTCRSHRCAQAGVKRVNFLSIDISGPRLQMTMKIGADKDETKRADTGTERDQ